MVLLPLRSRTLLGASLAIALVGSLSIASPLLAQQRSAYDRAIAAYLEADFELSRAGAEEALEDPTTSVGDLSRAHLLLALLAHVEQADRTVIEEQLENAVSLDASVVAPEGSPRAFSLRLEATRTAAANSPRRLAIERTEAGGARATLTGLPPRLIHHVSLSCGTASVRSAAGGLEVAVERVEATCSAEAIDARGRVLERASRDFLGTPVVPVTPPSGGSDDTPWIVLGVVGAVLVVGGAITIGVVLGTPSQSTLGAPSIPEWSR